MLHDQSLPEILEKVRRARPLPFVTAVALATLAFPLRTVRWRFILRLDGERLPFVPLWHATAIGFMANNLLPARAGEIARTVAAGKLTGVRYSSALASLAVERVMDGLTIIALLTVAVIVGGFSPGLTVGGVDLVRGSTVLGLLFLSALLAALFLVHRPDLSLGLLNRILSPILPDRIATRVLDLLRGMVAGMDALKSPPRFAAVAFWSLVVWLTNGASFLVMFWAFDLPVGWNAALMLQGLIALGVAIPSSPGFFGPFEAASRAALAFYGVAASQAVPYAVAYHIGGFIPITVLGLWSLSRAHLHLADLRSGDSVSDPAS